MTRSLLIKLTAAEPVGVEVAVALLETELVALRVLGGVRVGVSAALGVSLGVTLGLGVLHLEGQIKQHSLQTVRYAAAQP